MRIVITGRGLVTPLGNGLETNLSKLRGGETGISFVPKFAEVGLQSQVGGMSEENPECPLLNTKNKRFMSPNSRMAVAATYEALMEANLEPGDLKNKRIAIIIGCAGSAYEEVFTKTNDFLAGGHKIKKVTPCIVPRVMPSSAVANLSLILGITGETYDISSACASSSHAIMVASRLLEAGLYDIIISGGTEELNWVHALGFNAIRALTKKYNDTPDKACRPFDRDRDGFVIAEGAGIVVLETDRHAQTRGVDPIVAVSGKSANSNACDMVVPDPNSSAEVMKMAIVDAGLKPSDINFINTHGTGTPTGDPVELESIRRLFGNRAEKIPINSTKSMTGHMIGATGAVEVIYCSQMIEHKFISPSLNLENPDPGYEWPDYVRETREGVALRHVLSNSFGFGGTNCSLVISALD